MLRSAISPENFSRDCPDNRLKGDRAGHRGEAAEQGGVGHRAAELFVRDLTGRHGEELPGAKPAAKLPNPSSSRLREVLIRT